MDYLERVFVLEHDDSHDMEELESRRSQESSLQVVKFIATNIEEGILNEEVKRFINDDIVKISYMRPWKFESAEAKASSLLLVLANHEIDL